MSIASVVVWQLHKVYVAGLMGANLVDERQRGLRDGCAKNVIVLSTVLRDAKANLTYAHVVSLYVAKAFDSVSHHALLNKLQRLGLPKAIIEYMGTVYRSNKTVLEVSCKRFQPIRVTRGFGQEDPLSTLLFSMVVDHILKRLPSEVGYNQDPGNPNQRDHNFDYWRAQKVRIRLGPSSYLRWWADLTAWTYRRLPIPGRKDIAPWC